MNLASQTRLIIREIGLRPQKSKGQNFMISPFYLELIVKTLKEFEDLKDPEKNSEIILEIGAGTGNLTQYLLKEKKEVLAVELDEKLAILLKHKFAKISNFTLVHKNILKFDLEKDLSEVLATTKKKVPENLEKSLLLVGNLPYKISTTCLQQVLKFHKYIKGMVFTFQKEVAQRLLAEPGNKDYGPLTLFVKPWATPKFVAKISPKAFFPIPEVDSALLSFTIQDPPLITDQLWQIYYNLITTVFTQRRKTIWNSLKKFFELKYFTKELSDPENAPIFNFSSSDKERFAEEMRKVFQAAGVPSDKRPEQLSFEQYLALCKVLSSYY